MKNEKRKSENYNSLVEQKWDNINVSTQGHIKTHTKSPPRSTS